MLLAKTEGNLKEKNRFQMMLEAALLLQSIKERATFLIKVVCLLSPRFSCCHMRKKVNEESKCPLFFTFIPTDKKSSKFTL